MSSPFYHPRQRGTMLLFTAIRLPGFVRCILRALYSRTIVSAGKHLSNLVSRLRKTMIVKLIKIFET